jgi:hypothetical protein
MTEVMSLLTAIQQGDELATSRPLPFVYEELRRPARSADGKASAPHVPTRFGMQQNKSSKSIGVGTYSNSLSMHRPLSLRKIDSLHASRNPRSESGRTAPKPLICICAWTWFSKRLAGSLRQTGIFHITEESSCENKCSRQ